MADIVGTDERALKEIRLAERCWINVSFGLLFACLVGGALGHRLDWAGWLATPAYCWVIIRTGDQSND